MSRIEIFTPKQRMVMAENMLGWLEDLYKKAVPEISIQDAKKLIDLGLKTINETTFELVTDEASWLREQGAIHVWMQTDEGLAGGELHTINVPALFDTQQLSIKVANRLDEILFDTFRETPAGLVYKGSLRQKKYEELKVLARQMLIDDVLVEKDWLSFFSFKPKDGRQVIIETFYNRPFEQTIPIDFSSDNYVLVDDLNEKFRNIFYKKLNVQKLFSKEQSYAFTQPIAKAAIEAVQNRDCPYPYKQDTLDLIESMKGHIAMAAAQIKVSPVALAGAVADEFDRDLAGQIQKDWERLIYAIANDTSYNMREIDPIASELLGAAWSGAGMATGAGLAVSTCGLAALAGGIIWWNYAKPEDKEKLISHTKAFAYSATNYLAHQSEIRKAKKFDQANREAIELWLKQKNGKEILNAEQASRIREIFMLRLEEDIKKKWLRDYYIDVRMTADQRLQTNARYIDERLTGQKQCLERITVYQWERFTNIVT